MQVLLHMWSNFAGVISRKEKNAAQDRFWETFQQFVLQESLDTINDLFTPSEDAPHALAIQADFGASGDRLRQTGIDRRAVLSDEMRNSSKCV